jgi:hypothetical protein
LPLLEQINYEQCLLGKGGVKSIFVDDRFTFAEAVSAYESVLLLDAARFQTLLLMGEERAAQHHAEEFLAWHEASIFQLTPDDIARTTAKQMAHKTVRKESDVRLEMLREANDFKEKVLEIHRHSVQRIDLVTYLIEKGIRGRDYIEETRERKDTPLLILPVD